MSAEWSDRDGGGYELAPASIEKDGRFTPAQVRSLERLLRTLPTEQQAIDLASMTDGVATPEVRLVVRLRDGDRCRFCTLRVLWEETAPLAKQGRVLRLTPYPTPLELMVITCTKCWLQWRAGTCQQPLSEPPERPTFARGNTLRQGLRALLGLEDRQRHGGGHQQTQLPAAAQREGDDPRHATTQGAVDFLREVGGLDLSEVQRPSVVPQDVGAHGGSPRLGDDVDADAVNVGTRAPGPQRFPRIHRAASALVRWAA